MVTGRNLMKRLLLLLTLLMSFNLTFGQNDKLRLVKIESYPTPATNQFYIELQVTGNQPSEKTVVQVSNLIGAKVLEISWEGVPKKIEIPVADLGEGVYFYTITVGGDNLARKRLVIRR